MLTNLIAQDGDHFDYVTPLNEPQTAGGVGSYQEGNHISTDQQARICNDLRIALNQAGLTNVGVAESEDTSESDELISLDGYNSYGYTPPPLTNVGLVAVHTYGNTDPTDVYNLSVEMQTPLWMTEYGNTDTSGRILSRRIHDDMTQLRPNAWICWQLVKDDSHSSYGLMYNPLVAPTNPSFTTSSTIHESFYVVGQFSEFVSPGSIILSLGDDYTVAAYNPTNQNLVLVTINDTTAAFTEGFNLTAFTNLPPQAAASRTSFTENMNPLPNVAVNNGILVNTYPADSVTTLVLTNVSAPPLAVQNLGGGRMQLTWGFGILQVSANVGGPYQSVANATSPYIFTPSGTQQYFIANPYQRGL